MAEVTTIQPDLRTNNAAEQPLGGATVTTLAANEPYFRYGSGMRMVPTANTGQLYVPGPNNAVMGNPFGLGTNAYAASGAGQGFGGVSNAPSPANFLGNNFNYQQSNPYNPLLSLIFGLFGSNQPFAGSSVNAQQYSNGYTQQNQSSPAPNPYPNPFGAGVGMLPGGGKPGGIV